MSILDGVRDHLGPVTVVVVPTAVEPPSLLQAGQAPLEGGLGVLGDSGAGVDPSGHHHCTARVDTAGASVKWKVNHRLWSRLSRLTGGRSAR